MVDPLLVWAWTDFIGPVLLIGSILLSIAVMLYELYRSIFNKD